MNVVRSLRSPEGQFLRFKKLFWLTFLATLSPIWASADLMRGLSVPEYSFAGSSATLSCKYDLQQSQLYSLKWYHNNTEFYRYVPTERKGSIKIRPTINFVLHEVSRSQREVKLKLSRLTPYASGEYRCELIAEHPSFRTETLSATMSVLRDHLYPPVIEGWKDLYEEDDIIEIGCQPLMPSKTGPKPLIKWYLNGQMVAPERLSVYSGRLKENDLGVLLRVSAEEVAEAGGKGEAECRLILGNHQVKTSKELRVQSRPMSYMNTFFSSGTRRAFAIPPAVISLLFLFFM